VKTRLIFWVFAAPLWCISGLLAVFSLLGLLDAPNLASKNQQQRTALLKRAEFVDHYLATKSQLPSKDEFAKASSDLHDGSIYEYELHTSRPERGEGFEFPEWPEGKPHFAIGYWRGEWSEFYDSNSRTTTMDVTSQASCWVKDALWPLGASLVFGLPPFVVLRIWRRHLTRSLQAAPVLAFVCFLAQLSGAPELLR
jgi:hypothetical protein